MQNDDGVRFIILHALMKKSPFPVSNFHLAVVIALILCTLSGCMCKPDLTLKPSSKIIVYYLPRTTEKSEYMKVIRKHNPTYVIDLDPEKSGLAEWIVPFSNTDYGNPDPKKPHSVLINV